MCRAHDGWLCPALVPSPSLMRRRATKVITAGRALVGIPRSRVRLDLASVQYPQPGPHCGSESWSVVGYGQSLAEGLRRRACAASCWAWVAALERARLGRLGPGGLLGGYARPGQARLSCCMPAGPEAGSAGAAHRGQRRLGTTSVVCTRLRRGAGRFRTAAVAPGTSSSSFFLRPHRAP